jgi:hypothetical protein
MRIHNQEREKSQLIQIEILSHERLRNLQILMETAILDKLHENEEEERQK